jgi:transcriptional regulator with XRE-family HTH domain
MDTPAVDAAQFGAWRQRTRLTQGQVAEKFKVTRTTIQNWESGATPIPQAVKASCDLLEYRLRQENPAIGPVTLIYTDGPMFVDPYGPRRRAASIHQEPYQTNAAAIARVEELWGRDDFHNPFIILKSGLPIWNVVELERVIMGNDKLAPTLSNLLHLLADQAENSTIIPIRKNMLTPIEVNERQKRIQIISSRLRDLANHPRDDAMRLRFDQILLDLQNEGERLMDAHVNAVACLLV